MSSILKFVVPIKHINICIHKTFENFHCEQVTATNGAKFSGRFSFWHLDIYELRCYFEHYLVHC